MEQHCLRQRSVRLLLALLLWSPAAFAQATIVQISDTHIGLSTAPNALQHLQTVVNQINAMSPQPDAVIVSGDIGETSNDWTTAKNTLANLKAVVYFCPGNHDIHTTNISSYRQYFGNDYYSFKINNITFMVIDSQLLGNYDTFTSGKTPANVQPLPSSAQTESDTMLAWLGQQTAVANEIAVQHVALFPQSLSGGGTYPSTNPYWAIYDVPNDTNIHHKYRTEEINALTALNIHKMLAGHWHNQRNFTATSGSFTLDLRMAPAVAYAIGTGAQVGYTVHTISSTGAITTQFVACSGCK
jgi:3',5'-cyclic AMP phosphodiesterase CpdA